MASEPDAARELLEAFNAVFESYVEGESQSSIVDRLSSEVDRRGIPDVESAFLMELAEAVEDRTPVWFGPDLQ